MITVKEIHNITVPTIVNKVIDAREVAHITITTDGDMEKSVYDADNDGIVDFAKDLALSNSDWTQFNLILLS